MRIAAGVLLLIAAVFNLFGGCGYVAGGGLASVAGSAGTALSQQLEEQKKNMSPEERAKFDEQMKQANEGLKQAGLAKVGGGFLMIFGLFLFVMCGLQIAGGILLFMQKAKSFVMLVGILGLLAEIGGITMVKFGYANTIGLVGSALAIYAATQFGKTAAAASAAPPPAAAAGG